MATIDASIPLGIRPVQIESPLNAMAQFAQLQGAQSQNALMALKMEEIKRAAAEQQQIRTGLAAPDADPVKVLMTAGRPKEAMELAASQRAAEKDRLEMGLKKIGLAGQILSTAKDQPSYDAARTTAQSYGLDVSSMPPQFDPNVVQTKLQQSMSLKEQMEQKWKQMGFDLDVRKQGETERHDRSTEAVAQGNLGVSRSNLQLRGQELETARNQPRGQFIETTNGYVLADPKTGTVRPVTGPDNQPLRGKSADRSLNETQAKANLFGTRMQEADRILTTLEGKYSPGGVNAKMAAGEMPLVGAAAGYAGNLMLGETGQQAEQAQRDFINAVLRRESGAAIASSEFSNAQKQYFPQPGDSKAVLEQKRRNRKLAIQGLEVEVPGGFRGAPTLTHTGQGSGATGDWGSGGDKADPLGLRGGR